jgi:hypothetical protein
VKSLHHVLAGLCIAVVALAACGGGGGTSSVPSAVHGSSAPPQLNAATAAPGVANHTQVGTAKLVLALAPVLHGRNAQAIRARNSLSTTRLVRSGRRGPAFVDPVCGECDNIIDIYVDGELLTNLDGCAGSYDSICVSQTPDGTQSLNVPLFSTSTNDIVVEEFASCGNECGELIAMGDTSIGSFTPGSAVNALVTLQLNSGYIGILQLPSQNDPETMEGQEYLGLQNTCGLSAQQAQFGIYTADGYGDFVPIAGYGGTSTPTETATSDGGGSTIVAQTTITGLYFVGWDAGCDGVTVTASAPNPAYAISFDVLGPYPQEINPEIGPRYYWTNSHGSQGSFEGPFLTDASGNIYGTSGYSKCAGGTGPCPGGPYQAIWDQVWNYAYGSNSAFGILYGDLFPAVTTGTVDILNAPTPSPVPIASPSGSSGGVQSSPIPIASPTGGSGGVNSSPIPLPS